MSEDPQTTQEDVTKGELGGEAATSPSPTASTVATSTSGPSGEYTSKKRTRRMAGNSQEKDDDDVTRDGVIREEVRLKKVLWQLTSSFTSVPRQVLSALEADLLSCDVHVSLFVCAAASYRHDSVLRPFPNAFETTSGEKDIEKLVCFERFYSRSLGDSLNDILLNIEIHSPVSARPGDGERAPQAGLLRAYVPSQAPSLGRCA